jgi:arabinofuranosyltransferase
VRLRRLEFAWLTACGAGFLALCWLLRRFVTDDAWITARYAHNLGVGHGFVWNPGGPPAEGFSNPLLVAIESVAQALGLSAVGTARVVGIACGLGLLLVIQRLAPPIAGRLATAVALGVTALYPPMALWAVGGLETMPMALATTAGLLMTMRAETRRQLLAAGGVLALLPWLRPEGIAVALVLALCAWRGPWRVALGRVGLVAALPLASVALLEATRLVVYGHLLPNSVLYKAGSGGTFDVLGRFAAEATPAVALAAVGLVVARGRQRLLVAPVLVYALGSFGMLNSVNAFSRFMLPIWPPLALLAGLAVAAAARRRRVVLSVATVALGFLGFGAVQMGEATSSFADEYAACQQDARADAARWVRTHTPRHARFSISDAGLVPARAGGRTAIDDLSLNDPRIQRTGALPVAPRVDRVFRSRPQLILLLSTSPTTLEAPYGTDAALARDPRFHRYALAHVARGEGADCTYNLFIYRRRPAAPATRLRPLVRSPRTHDRRARGRSRSPAPGPDRHLRRSGRNRPA